MCPVGCEKCLGPKGKHTLLSRGIVLKAMSLCGSLAACKSCDSCSLIAILNVSVYARDDTILCFMYGDIIVTG